MIHIKFPQDVVDAILRIADAQEKSLRLKQYEVIERARSVMNGTWATPEQRSDAQKILDELGAKP